jgi:hypothetical protein
MNMHQKRRPLRSTLIVVFSLLITGGLFRLVDAGQLYPNASPAGTMNTIKNSYDALASGSFDSSAITGAKHGSALRISRCIINKLAGSPCP